MCLDTIFVGIGILDDSKVRALLAVSSGIPASSNIILPGLTTATQWSTAPLPLPILVSAARAVTLLSGKILIQILPPLRVYQVIALRAASICRDVTHAGPVALSPNSPKFKVLPATDKPFRLPRWWFLYLILLG